MAKPSAWGSQQPQPLLVVLEGALRAKACENRLHLNKLKVNFRLHSACTIFQPHPKALPLSKGRDATARIRSLGH